MSCQRLDILVRQARDATGNQEYSTTQGIPQREFVKNANHAQERIYNKMLQKRSTLFVREAFLNATAGEAEIELPDDVYLNHNIVSVEFSPTGNLQDMRPLDQRSLRQRTSVPGPPDSYVLRDGYVVVSPIPMSTVANAFRVNYQYVLPDLDIRRATITNLPGGDTITIDTSTLSDESLADLSEGWVDYVSIVDPDGAMCTTSGACRFESYDSNTGIITCADSFASSGNEVYLTFGKYATTHSQLPTVAERYIYTYMKLFAQLRDSNVEAVDTNPILKAIEDDILDGVELLEDDLVAIPILDDTFLNYADDFE